MKNDQCHHGALRRSCSMCERNEALLDAAQTLRRTLMHIHGADLINSVMHTIKHCESLGREGVVLGELQGEKS